MWLLPFWSYRGQEIGHKRRDPLWKCLGNVGKARQREAYLPSAAGIPADRCCELEVTGEQRALLPP